MSFSAKEVREKISKLLLDQREIALAGFTAESRAKFDRIQKDVDALEADAQRIDAMEVRTAHQESFTPSPRPQVGAWYGGTAAMSTEEKRSKANKAFRNYALRGWAGMEREERDLLTTSDASGGALIPQLFNDELIQARRFFGEISMKVKQKVTNNNGAPMKVSYSNDTANGLVLLTTEGTSAPAETDPTFLSKMLGVDTVSGGLIRVSVQEIEDSSFDLDSFIRDAFGKRYGRGLETAITTGKDSAGNVLPNQSAGGLLGAATVGATTASLSAGIGWTDIVATFGALDASYLNPARTAWSFNTSTRATLLGMKDGFGRPFWTPDPSGDGPFSTLLGYSVVLNQAMPNVGTANGTPVLFGSLQDAYMLRTDGQPTVLRLNERFMDTLEVGFMLFTRCGGVSLNAGVSPLVSIKQASN